MAVGVEVMADSARTVQVMKEYLGAVDGVVVGGAGWRSDCGILQPAVVGRAECKKIDTHEVMYEPASWETKVLA